MADQNETEKEPLTASSTVADIMRAYPGVTRWQAAEQLRLMRGTFKDDKVIEDDDE